MTSLIWIGRLHSGRRTHPYVGKYDLCVRTARNEGRPKITSRVVGPPAPSGGWPVATDQRFTADSAGRARTAEAAAPPPLDLPGVCDLDRII
jgi:hypothetical protein